MLHTLPLPSPGQDIPIDPSKSHTNNPLITDDDRENDLFDSDNDASSSSSIHHDDDDDDDENHLLGDHESHEESDEEASSPLLLALEQLESKVVSSLNEFKSHALNAHDELLSVLRPAIEVSSHLAPATARSVHAAYPEHYSLELCVDTFYTRINSELLLPVLLESAQSERTAARRALCLKVFHVLWAEWRMPGSYLDATGTVPASVSGNAVSSLLGPYGPGVGGPSSSVTSAVSAGGPLPMQLPTQNSSLTQSLLPSHEAARRLHLRSLRKSELLRRWVQSSIPNLTPGTFTSNAGDASSESRAVLSASATLKPSLRYMAERIGEADDAGALRLFLPVMRMIEGVLGRLFLERTAGDNDFEKDALRSSCIKFLEIVVLCFSNKALPGRMMAETGSSTNTQAARMRRDGSQANDFSLEDLPPGHPIIIRESLEEIAEYAFTTLRGLVLLGGQAKIDPNLLLAAAASSSSSLVGTVEFMGGGSSPLQQILAIIKPAALAFQKVESDAERAGATVTIDDATGSNNNNSNNGKDFFLLDRSTVELDFSLSQKSYSLSINAIQMLATKRPVFFKESSTSLARRTIHPPGGDTRESDGLLSKSAIIGIRTHLRSSCLTLLRHYLSVTCGCWEILVSALKVSGMEAQAERALQTSRQQLDLMKGGRAARNRAAIFYEWDQSADASRAEKRQRDSDDAEARVRAAKIARGLGSGVQLPTSMSDACELVLLNLKHMPLKRPPVPSTSQRKRSVDLDFIIDAVMTNGASLTIDENHWYDRDGGDAWTMEKGVIGVDGRRELVFHLNSKTLETAAKSTQKLELDGSEKVFVDQCKVAASNAFSRVLLSASSTRSEAVANFGKQLAARLAWTLQGVQPSMEIYDAYSMSVESTERFIKKTPGAGEKYDPLRFAKDYPLVSSCLSFDIMPKPEFPNQLNGEDGVCNVENATSALSTRVLNEAYVSSVTEDNENPLSKNLYSECLDVYMSAVVNACDSANKKPNDNEKKRIANTLATLLPHQILIFPAVTASSLNFIGSLCDIEIVSKKVAKASNESISESAAAHAAKAAAEKRATTALLLLRDVAFQRDVIRGSAIDCAVGIAAGRLPASLSVEDKALKLVMNVIFQKNSDCASKVVQSATKELEVAAKFSIENHIEITKANEENMKKKEKQGQWNKSPLAPQSEEEKLALERVKKPVVLFMALCVRQPEIIKVIMEMSSRDGADIMAKAVKTNMPKLAKAASLKHGAANIALKVANATSEQETPLLVSFLDNLAQASEKTLPSQDLIDACHEIQRNRSNEKGKKLQFIIPIVSGMKREELVRTLHEFVGDTDDVFKLSLHRMSERLSRYALIFREEPDPSEPSLRGMSSCEQMVFLHHLNFNAVGLPQKRYLDVIRLCLEDDDVFNDRVIQSALDYISGKFLEGAALPLAYMRTIILTCSKHESLHSWICHVLLPRLVDGKVYSDKRQWEGWMRCAKMLENTGDRGVSSTEAVHKLPEEQLKIYRAKYPK